MITECFYLENTPSYVFGEVWYNDVWVEGMQSGMARNCAIEMNESFDDDILAPSRDAVHGCVNRADVVGADFPIPRIIGNVAKEDDDGIAGTEFVFPALNPGGPFVE